MIQETSKVNRTITYDIRISIQEDDEMYVATCPDFDIVVKGLSRTDAEKNMMEAIRILMAEMYLKDARWLPGDEATSLSKQIENET